MNPFEVVKVSLQANRAKWDTLIHTHIASCVRVRTYFNVFDFLFVNIFFRFRTTQAPTTWSVAREIVRKDGLGLKGLNKGLTATIGRNGTFNMIYFGFYHSVREHFPAYEVQTSILEMHWARWARHTAGNWTMVSGHSIDRKAHVFGAHILRVCRNRFACVHLTSFGRSNALLSIVIDFKINARASCACTHIDDDDDDDNWVARNYLR